MLKPVFSLYLAIALSLFIIGAEANDEAPQIVRVAYAESDNPLEPSYYYQSLLRIALDKTVDTYGPYDLRFSNTIESVDRMHNMVAHGSADLIWASVNQKRSAKMRVIPINLLRDLNNYRLLLVRPENKSSFEGIVSLRGLSRFKAGNGTNWTDSRILEANGIKVVTAPNYGNLIKMLAAGRFDYISRGLHEIHSDIATFSGEELSIADGIVLRYKQPISYSFYVNENLHELALRLEQGLAIAEEDGSFLAAFSGISAYKAGLEELAKSRHVIELDNTQLNP